MFAFGVYGLCGYVSDLVWLLMVFCFVGGVLFVGDMIGFWSGLAGVWFAGIVVSI